MSECPGKPCSRPTGGHPTCRFSNLSAGVHCPQISPQVSQNIAAFTYSRRPLQTPVNSSCRPVSLSSLSSLYPSPSLHLSFPSSARLLRDRPVLCLVCSCYSSFRVAFRGDQCVCGVPLGRLLPSFLLSFFSCFPLFLPSLCSYRSSLISTTTTTITITSLCNFI